MAMTFVPIAGKSALLPAVCEYEVAKYPDDSMTAASAEALMRSIKAMLEGNRKDPAEAEKDWQAGRQWWPEAHAEREQAHRLFKMVERKAGTRRALSACAPSESVSTPQPIPPPRGISNIKEVTKEQFKEMYFRLGGEMTGWSLDYWNNHFEHEEKPSMKYLAEEPQTPEHTRMFIVSDSGARECRLFFMTEESEESFFDFPGKDEEDVTAPKSKAKRS